MLSDLDPAVLADHIDRRVLYAERQNRQRIAQLEARIAELERAAQPWYVRLYERLTQSLSRWRVQP